MSTAASPVKSLMRWPVATVDGDASLKQVAAALVADEVGALAVVEHDTLTGVVAERDVVRQVAAGADPDHTRVTDMMSADPVTIAPDDTVGHAAEVMREAGVRHLPVVDDGELVGFLSIRDLFLTYREAVDNEA